MSDIRGDSIELEANAHPDDDHSKNQATQYPKKGCNNIIRLFLFLPKPNNRPALYRKIKSRKGAARPGLQK